jgi:hypothetical protein
MMIHETEQDVYELNGKTEYQVQFKDEPAQNSMWIPFDQLNAYTQRAVRNKPPPRVE